MTVYIRPLLSYSHTPYMNICSVSQHFHDNGLSIIPGIPIMDLVSSYSFSGTVKVLLTLEMSKSRHHHSTFGGCGFRIIWRKTSHLQNKRPGPVAQLKRGT
jgi:hypothetical protein